MRSSFVVVTRIAVTCLFAAFVAANAFADLKVGIASGVVTPEKLLPISGGVGEPAPVKEKKGELEVRALVIEQGKTTIAIVSVPYLGFPGVLCDRVRAKVKGIQPGNVIIGSTHVHSAPDMYAFADESGKTGADLKYIDWVCGKTAETINNAASHLVPASVKIATAPAKGKIAYNYYAEQLFDPRCSVMQFLDAQNKPVATLVNYAIHPEILGPKRGILSPDLVGPLYERIASQGGGVGIFMNGAQGGMITADCRTDDHKGENNTWEECVRIGNTLADEALRIVKDAPIQKDPALYCVAKKVTFPVDSKMMQAIMKNSPLKMTQGANDKVTTQMNVVNFGNAQILTIPGEALPNVGAYLKRNMHGTNNLLFGLTNDAFGYMLCKEDFEAFERYMYCSRTSLGERTVDVLETEGLKLVKDSPMPQKLN